MNTKTNEALGIKIGESCEDKLHEATFAEALVTNGCARAGRRHIMTSWDRGGFWHKAVLQDGEDIIAARNGRYA